MKKPHADKRGESKDKKDDDAVEQSRPADERAVAAGDGRFVGAPNDQDHVTSSLAPHQARAPPPVVLGLSIKQFCAAVGISVAYYYELEAAGLAPRVMQFGRRKIISTEEAAIWCRERTARPVPSKEAAARPVVS
jgi:hypothetical protein